MKLLEDALNKECRRFWWWLFIAYCGFILWETIFSRTVSERQYELSLFWGMRMWINGDPQGRSVFVQYINNILFFIPFGFLLSEIVNGKWKLVLTIGMTASAGIEFIQFITSLGFAETDDVISNTVGAILGYLAWVFFRRVMTRR